MAKGPVTGKDLIREKPPNTKRYDWSDIADTLREDPMEWHKVFEKDRSSIVVAIRQGNISAVHRGLGFETKTANNTKDADPRTCSLWMRYNPSKVEDGLTEAIIRARRSR